jgi:ABC-type antimicrobial peptide transport system permease subunit
MVRNFFLVAWRNLSRQRFFSSIAVLGLTAALTIAFVIGAYVWNERQVNAELRNLPRQFMLQSKWKDPSLGLELTTLGQLPVALQENYPSLIKSFYRYDGVTSNVSFGEQVFREPMQIGDSSLLSMFGFELQEGDAGTALNRPFTVVLSAEAAQKYFGNQSALGKVLTIENFNGSKADFEVTGVMAPFGRNTVTQLFDDRPTHVFLPEKSLPFFSRDMAWENHVIPAFIELQPGIAPEALIQPLRDLVRKHTDANVFENYEPRLVPLATVHLSANDHMLGKMLLLLSVVAGFILLMALVNFVNIAISRATARMKEIGVRKTMGSLRHHLIVQFLVESWLIVLLSSLLALLTYITVRPFAAQLLEKPLPNLSDLPFSVWPLLVGFVFVTGLLAGIYPALVLSGISASRAVKGQWEASQDRKWLRRGLVGLQFSLAAVALSAAVIISRQVDLFFSRQLGYDTEMILTAQLPRDWTAAGISRMEGIRQQFEKLPEVKSAAVSFEIMDGKNGGSIRLYREGSDSSTAVASQFLSTDEHYASTYDIPLLAGSYLRTPGGLVDTLGVVINETQARTLGWQQPADAVGQTVYMVSSPHPFRITGVARDVHFGSMHKAIESTSFLHLRAFHIYRYLSFKLRPGRPDAAIDAIRKSWGELMPGTAFEFRFMDDALRNLYRSELQLRRASFLAAFVALLIVSMGLVGLVALSIQRRMKEMGIRKVMGASVVQVVRLFVQEFLPVLITASLIALPSSWLLMRGWLNNFAYRIDLNPLYFFVAIAAAILACAILIGLQTMRLGWRKPADIIRAGSGE